MKYQFSLRDLRNLEFNYSKSNRMEEYLKLKLFGKSAMDILTPVYLLAVRFSPRLLKEYNLDLALIRREPKREKVFRNGPFFIRELEKIRFEISEILELLHGLGHQATKSKWITAEIDKITGLIYFTVVISVFIIAIIRLPDFLNTFVIPFNDSELAKIAIFDFAFLAVCAMLIMIFLRLRTLRKKAVIVFKYLVALETIRIEEKDFKTILENIERYLDSNDWILAEYWLSRTMADYENIYLSKLERDDRDWKYIS